MLEKEITRIQGAFGHGNDDSLNFISLVEAITRIHKKLIVKASRAVNISLTIRNWIIGYYIREYELGGSDRAAYGEKLLESLLSKLTEEGMKRVDARELRRFRQFYLAYPQIREALSPDLVKMFPASESVPKIRDSVAPKLDIQELYTQSSSIK